MPKGKESAFRPRHMQTPADLERKEEDKRGDFEANEVPNADPDAPKTGILPEEQKMDCHHCGHHRKEHHGGPSESCHYQGCPCRAWSPYFHEKVKT